MVRYIVTKFHDYRTPSGWEKCLWKSFFALKKAVFLSRTTSDNHEIWSQYSLTIDLLKSPQKIFHGCPTPAPKENPLYWHKRVSIGDSSVEMAWGLGKNFFWMISKDHMVRYIVTKFHNYPTPSGREKCLWKFLKTLWNNHEINSEKTLVLAKKYLTITYSNKDV